MALTTNPLVANPHVANPWITNPWVSVSPLYFTNTGASLDPYIEVTGTPEILWTWSDGSTSSAANPGVKNLIILQQTSRRKELYHGLDN